MKTKAIVAVVVGLALVAGGAFAYEKVSDENARVAMCKNSALASAVLVNTPVSRDYGDKEKFLSEQLALIEKMTETGEKEGVHFTKDRIAKSISASRLMGNVIYGHYVDTPPKMVRQIFSDDCVKNKWDFRGYAFGTLE